MPLGNQPNVLQLNAEAVQIASLFRQAAELAQELQAYVVNLGASGLQNLNGGGFSVPDSTAFLTQCSYLANVAGVIQGTATVAAPFNFVNAWVALTGPD